VLDFFAISDEFSMIEISAPAEWIGKTMADLKLARSARIVAVAVRGQAEPGERMQWRFPEPDAPFAAGEIVLLAGASNDLSRVQE
jgi:trk system potassium uptake protein